MIRFLSSLILLSLFPIVVNADKVVREVYTKDTRSRVCWTKHKSNTYKLTVKSSDTKRTFKLKTNCKTVRKLTPNTEYTVKVKAKKKNYKSVKITTTEVDFRTILPVADLSTTRVRDPYIYVDHNSGYYYLYNQKGLQGDEYEGEGVDFYVSTDLETWYGPGTAFENTQDSLFVWAPEVHKYNDTYHMFVTLTEDKTYTGFTQYHKRSTVILESSTPYGPFNPVSHEAQTKELAALDGTFYVEHNTPYMVYAHEWKEIQDGTMNVTKLNEDLSVTDSTVLFNASSAEWVQSKEGGYITDGPSLYRTQDGQLIMLWSSFSETGYAVGIARSESGSIFGPWVHEEPLLTSDGGHGMIFESLDGQLYLTIHQTNEYPNERVQFIPIKEINNNLVVWNTQ